MKRNIQHSTFNIQRPLARRGSLRLGCWALNVECSVFLILTLSALSVFGQTNTNSLPALAPPLPEMPPTFLEQPAAVIKEHPGTALIITGVAVLALVLVLFKMLLRKEVPMLAPEIAARQALAKLQSQQEDGKVLSEISQVLRRYIVAAFGLPVTEMTTAEFCAALAGSEKVGMELARTISSFLRECDERKFAPPSTVGVQASACSVNPPPIPEMLKRELQPAGARALELVSLVETATHRQDACATKK